MSSTSVSRSIFMTEAGSCGFRCWFDGEPPHYTMDTFPTIKDALDWIDPHRERVWIATEDPHVPDLLGSNSCIPGSVADRISRIAISLR